RDAGDAMDGCGLARAVRPQEAEEIARLDRERYVFDRDGAGAIDLAEVGNLKCGSHVTRGTIQTAYGLSLALPTRGSFPNCRRHRRSRARGAPQVCGGGTMPGLPPGTTGRSPNLPLLSRRS